MGALHEGVMFLALRAKNVLHCTFHNNGEL